MTFRNELFMWNPKYIHLKTIGRLLRSSTKEEPDSSALTSVSSLSLSLSVLAWVSSEPLECLSPSQPFRSTHKSHWLSKPVIFLCTEFTYHLRRFKREEEEEEKRIRMNALIPCWNEGKNSFHCIYFLICMFTRCTYIANVYRKWFYRIY